MSESRQWYVSHVYNDGEKLVCNAVQKITDERADNLDAANKRVIQYFSSQHVAQSVFANRNDILESIVTLGSQYLGNPSIVETALENASIDISRRLANMCSMFRSFLDHFDRYFVYTHGKASDEFRQWKQILAAQYDGSVNYRIVYCMRNYIQHYDMPPLSISINDSAEEEGCTISVDIKLSDLMKDVTIKNKLSYMITPEQSTIPILGVLDEWSECVDNILLFANRVRIKDVADPAGLIANLRNTLGLDEKGKIALTSLPNVTVRPESLKLNFNWFAEEKAKLIVSEIETNSPNEIAIS